MSGYTKTNLKELEDSAASYGLSPSMEARFARGALDTKKLGLSYQRLAPSFRQPFGHKHAEQEEVYVVVAGGGRMKLEDEVIDLRQWDAIRVEPGVTRAFEAGPDGAELLAFGAGPRDETEIRQDWWSDE